MDAGIAQPPGNTGSDYNEARFPRKAAKITGNSWVPAHRLFHVKHRPHPPPCFM